MASITPLNDSGVDFSNETQAANFILEILDDSVLQVIDNGFARYFWYGIVVFITITAVMSFSQQAKRKLRYESPRNPSKTTGKANQPEKNQSCSKTTPAPYRDDFKYLHEVLTQSYRIQSLCVLPAVHSSNDFLLQGPTAGNTASPYDLYCVHPRSRILPE